MPQNIIFSKNISDSLESLISSKNHSKELILCDTNTEKYCLPLLNSRNNVILIPEGEKSKNLDSAITIWNKMDEFEMDRNSCLINLGGGMISDIGGFCAGTYKRGIEFINIPTSLLAITDASIGGKVGVNLGDKKNHIGLFKEASDILVYPQFLKTLPEKQFLSGFAEIFKHAIIKGGTLWEKLDYEELKSEIDDEVLKSSMNLKMDIVGEDIEESGIRKVLNFGHSIGHLIESYGLANSKRFKYHGEAIAEGMLIESIISNNLNLLPNSELDKIQFKLTNTFEMNEIDSSLDKYIYQNIIHDKKNNRGEILMSLPLEIGNFKYDVQVNKHTIEDSIIHYNKIISG